MTTEEFLKDVCPNHTDKSKWNKSELLYILELHTEQLCKHAVVAQSEQLCQHDRSVTNRICDDCGSVITYVPDDELA